MDAKHQIYYDPENIIFNIYGGFRHYLLKYTKKNLFEHGFEEIINSLSEQFKFECFLNWLIKSFNIYKTKKNKDLLRCLKKIGINKVELTRKHQLNINRNIFKCFPKVTSIFFQEDYISGTVINNELYLNNFQNYAQVLRPSYFFDNFGESRQKKLFNSMVKNESYKLQDIFNNIQNYNELKENKIESVLYLNEKYSQNIDFVVFCLKVLDYFDQEICFFCYLEELKQCLESSSLNFESNYPIDSNFSKSNYLKANNLEYDKSIYQNIQENDKLERFFNNLIYIDSSLNCKIFAQLLYFSNFNYYYLPSLKIEWSRLFPENTKLMCKKNETIDFV